MFDISTELVKTISACSKEIKSAVVLGGNSKFKRVYRYDEKNTSFIRISLEELIEKKHFKLACVIFDRVLHSIKQEDRFVFNKLLDGEKKVVKQFALELQKMYKICRWLKEVQCKVLICYAEWPPHSIFVNAARLAGCKVFQILHGTPSRLFWPFVSDKIWVWGQTTKKYFENFGCEPGRLEIIGNLEMELYKERFLGSKPDDNKKNLLFFAQMLGDKLFDTNIFTESLDWLRAIMKTFEDDWTLTVRMHPGEGSDDIQKVKEKLGFLGNRLIISIGNELVDDVNKASIACTCSSSAILASLMAKIPSFLLWPSEIDCIQGSPILPDEVVIKDIKDISTIHKYENQDIENIKSDILTNVGCAFEVAAKYLISEINILSK
jgi:hypothetical protein